MEVTTVKVHQRTKMDMDSVKREKETYDDLIQRLLEKEKKKKLREALIEGYKSMGKEDLKELEEWEVASPDWD